MLSQLQIQIESNLDKPLGAEDSSYDPFITLTQLLMTGQLDSEVPDEDKKFEQILKRAVQNEIKALIKSEFLKQNT